MQKRMLKTNCPNCAGALQPDGNCPYCGTHVRYANELDIDAGDLWHGSMVEIMIHIKRGNETILLPVRGSVNSITVTNDTANYDYYDSERIVPYLMVRRPPRVEFDFCGHVISPEH